MPKSNGTSSTSSHRLPVNQRRHKVAPELRKRVSLACNNCNVRRIKCSGSTPCSQCEAGNRSCSYPAPVKKIHVSEVEWEELKNRCAMLERAAVEGNHHHRDILSSTSPAASSTMSATLSSSTPTPDDKSAVLKQQQQMDEKDDESSRHEGRLLSDPNGITRFLGSSSGATFLDLLKEFMMGLSPFAWPNSPTGPGFSFLESVGKYQTSDSQPLISHENVNPYEIPKKPEIETMLHQLNYFVQQGGDRFPSGGIFYWGNLTPDSLLTTFKQANQDPNDIKCQRRLALYHASFALACLLGPPSDSGERTRKGEEYFTRARKIIGNPLDTTLSSVYDIPVLAMMGLYLVEMNRRDAAYLYVSWGMHLAIMHGVHRGHGFPDEKEASTRAFWTLFILDRWLSCLMGRPPTILDNSIQLPPPTFAPDLPSEKGLVAHIELSKICGYLICNIYRISPYEDEHMKAPHRVEKTLDLLSNWLRTFSRELYSGSGSSEDKAVYELHMTYHQLVILTVRPVFFQTVKNIVAHRLRNMQPELQLEQRAEYKHIERCIEAARNNLQLGQMMRNMSPGLKLMASGLHNIFNATIVLLLKQLLSDQVEPRDVEAVQFAMESFKAEAQGESNYPKDCFSVLMDLKGLVEQLRSQNLDMSRASQVYPPNSSGMQMAAQMPPTTAYDVSYILNPAPAPLMAFPQHQAEILNTWIGADIFALYEDSLMPSFCESYPSGTFQL